MKPTKKKPARVKARDFKGGFLSPCAAPMTTYRLETHIPGIKSWGCLPEHEDMTLDYLRRAMAFYASPVTKLRVTETTTATRRVNVRDAHRRGLKMSLLPPAAASQAAMVEQGAKALFAYCVAPWSLAGRGHREHYREYARAVLASVGLVEGKV